MKQNKSSVYTTAPKDGYNPAISPLAENAIFLQDIASKANQLKNLNPKAKLLLDEYQAANVTGFEVATLRKRRWQGLAPRFLKIGSKIRYDYFELETFLDSCVRKSTTDQGIETTAHTLINGGRNA